MFPLQRRSLPASKDELANAVEEGLRRFVHKTGPIVDVRSRVFPYIDEIVINLDGAKIDALPPRSQGIAGGTKPAFEVAAVNLTARNIGVRGVPLNLQFEARGVCLDQAFDARGEIVLLPRRIDDGEISFSAAQLDVEEAIARILATEARAQGITIEQVRLALRERGPRSIAGE
ncbi:MAG TPA: hypothetical protein VFO30_00545, partial [Chthoniobacterales bacterium]|nr:hypothetical protein [Chthoniobacterales bacterium]